MHARVCGPKSLSTLYQIMNKTCFPSLVDEIAEPRPDMNTKVAAFTLSGKSINTQPQSTWYMVQNRTEHNFIENYAS